WQRSTDGGTTWSNIAGATAATLSVPSTTAQNGSAYRATLTTPGGSLTSGAATLTVGALTSPSSQTVIAGQTATFTVTLSNGAAPPVPWQVSTDGGITWTGVAGATANTLGFTAAANQNADQFRAEFNTSAGLYDSSAATLTVETVNDPVSEAVMAG